MLHADLSGISDAGWNEIVVDGQGNAYVNSIGFDFPGGEFAPGLAALGRCHTVPMEGQTITGGEEYFALRTFRRDGSPVSTPIWLAPSGGRLYGYTPGRSWKVRRLRRNPRVEIAPSDFAGEPHGPWRSGNARVLPPTHLRTAKRAMTAKYGNKFRWFTLVLLVSRPRKYGGRAVGLEISLDPE